MFMLLCYSGIVMAVTAGILLGLHLTPVVYIQQHHQEYPTASSNGTRSYIVLVQLSRDHWTRNMGFPIGGQFELTVYLAWFLADRTIGRAFATRSRLSVCLSSVCDVLY